jgi:hypothetical protein
VIDLTSETTLSLKQAARLLPPGRGDRPVTLSCVLRWVLRGARGPLGDLVRLEAVRLGGRWITSREALQRFTDALTPDLTGGQSRPAPRTPGRRQQASERAAQQLKQMGM